MLLGERNVLALHISPRAAAGVRVKHECKQAQRLRFLGQQLGHESGEKDCFVGEIAADDIGPTGVGPPFGKGGVDGVEYSVEPAGKFLALRDAEWNAGLPNLVFGPNESLTHGRRRCEERRGDCLRIQPEHHLQNQRRTDADLDGRMRAGEHQGQTMIWDFRIRWRRVQLLAKELQLRGGVLAAAASSGDIDRLSPRNGQQPRFRVRRTAAQRPIGQR